MSVATVYRAVITDVINNIKEDFVSDGLNETHLEKLRETWENKLIECGVPSNGLLGIANDDVGPPQNFAFQGLPSLPIQQQTPPLLPSQQNLSIFQNNSAEILQANKLPPIMQPTAQTPLTQQTNNLPQLDGLGDEGESLGSDLDDSDNDEGQADHFILCQFEKVTRVKNKRKCTFKSGIMHLNSVDMLFNTANAEFEW